MAKRFETGDLSKNEFCRREGISGCKLNYWLKNLESERSQDVTDAEFIEVIVSGGETTTRPQKITCQVELPQGVKLRFFGAVE